MAGSLKLTVAMLTPLALASAGTIGPLPASCPATLTPLSSYIALGAAGCSIGGFTFSDFQFAVQPSGTGAPIGASDVMVNWAAASVGVGIRFSSSGLQVGPGQTLGYWLSYNIDPQPPLVWSFGEALWIVPEVGSPPPIIRGGGDEEGGGPEALSALLAASSVLIDTQLCVGGLFTGPGNARTCSLGGTTPVSVYFYNPGGSLLWNGAGFGSPVSTLGVLNSIMLGGGESGARLWALDNQAYQVPEPAAWLLLGTGLALLGLRARRRAA